MCFAGGIQNRPKGGALPSLFIGTFDTVREHVCAANGINPTATLINQAISPEMRRVIHTFVNAPRED